MEVEFTQTLEDVLALNQYYLAQSPALRSQQRKVQFVVALLLAGGWLLLSSVMPLTLWWAVGAGITLYVFVVFVLIYPRSVRRRSLRLAERMYAEGRNASLLRRRRFTITPETITVATDISVSTYKWLAIEKIIIEQPYAYFFVGAVQAHVLPKRAFATVEAFLEYVETARRYHREAAGAVGQLPASTV
jgi:hypothetical protein